MFSTHPQGTGMPTMATSLRHNHQEQEPGTTGGASSSSSSSSSPPLWMVDSSSTMPLVQWVQQNVATPLAFHTTLAQFQDHDANMHRSSPSSSFTTMDQLALSLSERPIDQHLWIEEHDLSSRLMTCYGRNTAPLKRRTVQDKVEMKTFYVPGEPLPSRMSIDQEDDGRRMWACNGVLETVVAPPQQAEQDKIEPLPWALTDRLTTDDADGPVEDNNSWLDNVALKVLMEDGPTLDELPEEVQRDGTTTSSQGDYTIRGVDSTPFANDGDSLEDFFGSADDEDQPGKWQEKYEELVQFKRVHGHCNVRQPSLGTTTSSDSDESALALWVKRQRYHYKRSLNAKKKNTFKPERMQALTHLGFVWDIRGNSWGDKLDELREFVTQFGHANVPLHYARNRSLGIWVKGQRHQHKQYAALDNRTTLTSDRIAQLDALGIIWNPTRGRKKRPITTKGVRSAKHSSV